MESRGRTQSCGTPPADEATKANLEPSGERAMLSGSKICLSGGRMLTRNGCAGAGARNMKPIARAMAAAAHRAATIQASFCEERRRAATGAGTPGL